MCFDYDDDMSDLEILESMSGIVKSKDNILKDDLACYKLMIKYGIVLVKEEGEWWSYTDVATRLGSGLGGEDTFEYNIIRSANTPNRAICKAVIGIEEDKREKVLKAYLDGCYDKPREVKKDTPHAYHQAHWGGQNQEENQDG